MSGIESDLRAWSGRRWVVVVGTLLAAQLVLVFLLSAPFGAPRPGPTGRPAFALSGGGAPGSLAVELAGLEDPTVFASAHPGGFSGPGWLRVAPPRHTLAERRPPARQLGSREGMLPTPDEGVDLPTEFVRHLPAYRSPVLPAGRLAETPPPRSTLEISESLSPRLAGELPRLSARRHSDVLAPTVVRLTLGPDGRIFSLIPLQSSGLRQADLEAMNLARGLRFHPAPRGGEAGGGGFESGQLIFYWHAIELGETNGAAPNR